MANLPYIDGNESKVLGLLKMYSRMGAFPLDATSVFNTKEDLLAYINETGSYAYPGQVVAVANGDVTNIAHDDDYSLYIIRSDRTIQEIGKNLTFASVDEATTFIDTSRSSIRAGELITVADANNGYSLYMVRDDYSLHRLSFEASDIPDVSWSTLQGKPVSSPDNIDDAVAKKHEHTNKETLDKISEIDGQPSYDGNKIAYKSDVAWEKLEDKPTTLAGFGITDAYTSAQVDNQFVKTADVVTIPEAGKILKLDDNAQIPASVLSGVIPLANLPHGALERCVVVANDDARFALSNTEVQTGDTIKVTETGMMYFVVDSSKLAEEAGYEVYTAGSASSVEWSGIQNTPNNLAGYGINDAVNVSEVTTVAEANKLLKLNEEGKLPADITGDATTVGGKSATDFVEVADVAVTAEANKLLKLNDDAKLPADITGDADTLDGKHATDFISASDVTDVAEANKLLKLDSDGKLPTDITGEAGSVEWDGVKNTPTTLAGYGINDAVNVSEVTTVAEANKLLKLNDAGELPANITGNAATASSVEWTGVNNTPTTLDGYGITDAFTQDAAREQFVAIADTSTVAEAGKILKLNSEAKLPADITGNAATASSVEWTGVKNTPTTLSGYGITDAFTQDAARELFVSVDDVVTTPAPDKLLKLDGEGKLPVSILSGTIPMANLPHGALERCVVVASDTARFALTNLNVQTGDTVKVTNTGKMYFVVDDTKLGTEAGYEVYTAGSASSVPWSGITGTPTTLSGYGITDAYTSDVVDANFVKVTDVAITAEANKLLKLNVDGKLPADITGEAGSVAWGNITGMPTTVAGFGIADVYTKDESDNKYAASDDIVSVAEANKVLKLNADGKLPTSITGEAGSVAWGNIIGKPTAEASEIDDAVNSRHGHQNKDTIDKIGVNADGRMTYNETNTVAYMADLASIIHIGASGPDDSMPVGGLWLDTSPDANA